jgi:hypothetical protein
MDKLSTGDVVLFTGNKQVRAIGEVGASFRNAAAGAGGAQIYNGTTPRLQARSPVGSAVSIG